MPRRTCDSPQRKRTPRWYRHGNRRLARGCGSESGGHGIRRSWAWAPPGHVIGCSGRKRSDAQSAADALREWRENRHDERAAAGRDRPPLRGTDHPAAERIAGRRRASPGITGHRRHSAAPRPPTGAACRSPRRPPQRHEAPSIAGGAALRRCVGDRPGRQTNRFPSAIRFVSTCWSVSVPPAVRSTPTSTICIVDANETPPSWSTFTVVFPPP